MPKTEQTLDEIMEQIEKIVAELEQNQTSLDASMHQWEEGMKLVKQAETQLAAARAKMDVIIQQYKAK